jgi:hypothetical protein
VEFHHFGKVSHKVSKAVVAGEQLNKEGIRHQYHSYPGSPTLATYDAGRSLCKEIQELKERVKILTDVIFQLVQKLSGDQTDTGTSLNNG